MSGWHGEGFLSLTVNHIWHLCGCSGRVGGVNLSQSWQCSLGTRRCDAEWGHPRERSKEMMKKMKWGRAPRQEVTRHKEEEEEEVGIFTTTTSPSFHHTHTLTHTLFSPSTIANYQICWLGSVHLKLSVTADGRLTGPFIRRCQSCRWERTPSLLISLTFLSLQGVPLKSDLVVLDVMIRRKVYPKTVTTVCGDLNATKLAVLNSLVLMF